MELLVIEHRIYSIVVLICLGIPEIIGSHIRQRLTIIEESHREDGESGLSERSIYKEPCIDRRGGRTIHRDGILDAGLIVPLGISKGIFHNGCTYVRIHRSEGLLVGVTETRTDIMVEVRFQIRVTERYVQRVRIIRNRHQLGRRRLSGTTEIEHPEIGVIVDVIEYHGLRRPVDDLILVDLVIGPVESVRRIDSRTELGTEFLLLKTQVDSRPMVMRLIQNIV